MVRTRASAARGVEEKKGDECVNSAYAGRRVTMKKSRRVTQDEIVYTERRNVSADIFCNTRFCSMTKIARHAICNGNSARPLVFVRLQVSAETTIAPALARRMPTAR